MLDAVAKVLAAAHGHGSAWNPETDLSSSTEASPRHTERLPVSRQGRTIEQASRAINPHHPPAWFEALPADEQAKTLEWSGTHKLNRRGNGVHEHEAWNQDRGAAALPWVPSAADIQIALSAADLSGPLRPLLMLYALEDGSDWPIVELHMKARGHSPNATMRAAARIMCPGNSIPVPPIKDCAIVLNIPIAQYHAEVKAADRQLREWLDLAARRFVNALRNENSARRA